MKTSVTYEGMQSRMVTVAGSRLTEVTFGSLYREHHSRVLAYFMRRFDKDTAVDCAADVFTVTWRRINEVPDGEEAIRWLYGVCRNVGRNQERSLRRLGRLRARLASETDPGPLPPEARTMQMSEEELVGLAMSRLRSRDREILRLAAWEELPRADIAEILDISTHAVDQRIQRATDRLARAYQSVSLKKGSAR